MKKLIIVVSIIFSLTIKVLANQNKEEKNSNRIVIIVNENLQIEDSLNTYTQDLKNEGYEPLLKEWSLIAQPDPKELKEYLKSLYNSSDGLQGAVFVGKLPVALFQEFEIPRIYAGPLNEENQPCATDPFPADRYFMDFDTWEDLDGDGIFDQMPEDVNNEIWVSRITAYGITIPTNPSFLEQKNNAFTLKDYFQEDYETTLTKKYFQKNHEFRTGMRLYDEKSWNYITPLGESTDNVCLNKKTNFFIGDLSKADFITLLNEESNELGLWLIHGLPDSMLLNEDGEIISSDELKSINVKSAFLLPTSCLIGRYTERDYLAGILLFSEKSEVVAMLAATDETLAWKRRYFSYPFQEGENIGNSYLAYLKSMNNDEASKLWTKTLETHRVILGDGTLKRQRYTIKPDKIDFRQKKKVTESLKSLISPAAVIPIINTLRFYFLTSQIFWDAYINDYEGDLTYRLSKEKSGGDMDLELIYEGKQTMAIDPSLKQDDIYYLQYVWSDLNADPNTKPIISKVSKQKASNSDLAIEYANDNRDSYLEQYILERRTAEELEVGRENK